MPKINNTDIYINEAPTADATIIFSREADGGTRSMKFSDMLVWIGATATKTTKLAITDSKVSGSTYSVTSSGVDYTKSGDDGNLLSTAVGFNGAEYIGIFLNGVYQGRTHAVWASATSFTLDTAVDNGDEIIILS